MKGRNIFDTVQRGDRTFSLGPDRACIFISHQKHDAPACRLLADFLIDKGLDVYFDEYDKSIDRNDPKSVVDAIQSGLNNSTHTLVVLSEHALASTWVPWEVGYSYAQRPKKIYALTLRDVSYRALPEYFQILPIIRGTKSLIETLVDFPLDAESRREVRWFSESSSYPYPLSCILSVDR